VSSAADSSEVVRVASCSCALKEAQENKKAIDLNLGYALHTM
jgi:hypothetical protein